MAAPSVQFPGYRQARGKVDDVEMTTLNIMMVKTRANDYADDEVHDHDSHDDNYGEDEGDVVDALMIIS